jgi:DNA-binding transcriptional LysR family regulator
MVIKYGGLMSLLSIDLNDLYLFAQIVEYRSLTAAGEVLGISKSSLSRRISLLEAQFGIRLLHRTSRRLKPTDVGLALYEHCRAIIAEAEAGEAAVHRHLTEPSGLVHISLPVVCMEIKANLQTELLPQFMLRYPKIRLAISVSDRRIDLIEDDVDIAIVEQDVRQPSSSSIAQVALGGLRWGFVAAPGYLAQRETPGGPDKLGRAEMLLYTVTKEQVTELQLNGPGGATAIVAINARLQSGSISLLKKAVVGGLGIACLPLQSCRKEIDAGCLCVVMPDWSLQRERLVMRFLTRRSLMPAVGATIDAMKVEIPQILKQNGYF